MERINKDCRSFKGFKPCFWNKTRGYECASCDEYRPKGDQVLIIKLDAIGDVLRSTCIVPKIKEKYPDSYLTWITKPESMELLEFNPEIDEVWNFHDMETLSRLLVQKWSFVYNLDNSYAGSALASIAKAREKTGFFLEDGCITATSNAALNWLKMAIFDRVKKENSLSYQEIMYKICEFPFPIHRPCLYLSEKHLQHAKDLISKSLPDWNIRAPIIGINTGSGSRWPKKMLGTKQIVEVIRGLLAKQPDCYILLLGGPNEVLINEEITGSFSTGKVTNMGCNHTILQFAAIVRQCDILLCGDTLALHIATALEVKSVAVFGPTSFTEIYDYDGLIEKVRTEGLDCLCCYSDCDKVKDCMTMLSADYLVEKLIKNLEPWT